MKLIYEPGRAGRTGVVLPKCDVPAPPSDAPNPRACPKPPNLRSCAISPDSAG